MFHYSASIAGILSTPPPTTCSKLLACCYVNASIHKFYVNNTVCNIVQGRPLQVSHPGGVATI